MAKRKIPPMPVEFFAIDPRVLRMGNAELGIFTRLVTHFWLTDCSPLPETDYQRFLLARAHKPTWSAHKSEIREILDEICPELAEALALYRKRSSILRHLSDRGGAAHKAASLKRLQKSNAVSPTIANSQTPQISERNRASAPLVQVKPAGSGFVEKPR